MSHKERQPPQDTFHWNGEVYEGDDAKMARHVLLLFAQLIEGMELTLNPEEHEPVIVSLDTENPYWRIVPRVIAMQDIFDSEKWELPTYLAHPHHIWILDQLKVAYWLGGYAKHFDDEMPDFEWGETVE